MCWWWPVQATAESKLKVIVGNCVCFAFQVLFLPAESALRTELLLLSSVALAWGSFNSFVKITATSGVVYALAVSVWPSLVLMCSAYIFQVWRLYSPHQWHGMFSQLTSTYLSSPNPSNLNLTLAVWPRRRQSGSTWYIYLPRLPVLPKHQQNIYYSNLWHPHHTASTAHRVEVKYPHGNC